jgi:hypothetical protein
MITEEEWETFKNSCARKERKDLCKWGLDMCHMNTGSFTLETMVTTARGRGGKRRMLIL